VPPPLDELAVDELVPLDELPPLVPLDELLLLPLLPREPELALDALPDEEHCCPASQLPLKSPVPSEPPHATVTPTATKAPNTGLVCMALPTLSRHVPPTEPEIVPQFDPL
jgi:hypothetical protein